MKFYINIYQSYLLMMNKQKVLGSEVKDTVQENTRIMMVQNLKVHGRMTRSTVSEMDRRMNELASERICINASLSTHQS